MERWDIAHEGANTPDGPFGLMNQLNELAEHLASCIDCQPGDILARLGEALGHAALHGESAHPHHDRDRLGRLVRRYGVTKIEGQYEVRFCRQDAVES